MHVPKFIKWLIIVVGVVIAAILSLAAFVFWYSSSGVFGTDHFAKEAWNATIRDGDDLTCYRGGMAKDIRDNILSNKMTKEDVVALLGKPDGNIFAQEYQYVLGMCSGLGFDYDNLHVYFDEQDRFAHAEISQH